MGLLNNLGNAGNAGNPILNMLMGGGNPMQMINQNPQMKQAYNQIIQMTGGNANNAKNMVIEKIKSQGISRADFETIKKYNPSVAKELEQYIK